MTAPKPKRLSPLRYPLCKLCGERHASWRGHRLPKKEKR